MIFYLRKEKRKDLLCADLSIDAKSANFGGHVAQNSAKFSGPLPPNIKPHDSLQAIITLFYMNIMILSYFSVNVMIPLNFAFYVRYPSSVLRSRYKHYTSGGGFGEKNKMKKKVILLKTLNENVVTFSRK